MGGGGSGTARSRRGLRGGLRRCGVRVRRFVPFALLRDRLASRTQCAMAGKEAFELLVAELAEDLAEALTASRVELREDLGAAGRRDDEDDAAIRVAALAHDELAL